MGFFKRLLNRAEAVAAERAKAATHAAPTSIAGPAETSAPADAEVIAVADRLIDEGNREEDAGHLPRANALYQEAAALAPRHARAHLNIGILLAAGGNAEGAAAAYEQVLAIDRRHAFGNYNYARLRFMSGDFVRAEDLLRAALHTKPDFEQAFALLASVLDAMGRTTLALDAIEQALKLNPSAVGSWISRATMFRALRRFDEAEDAARQALGRDPANADALRLHSLLLSDQGFAQEALVPLQAALRAEPGRLDVRSDELLLLGCTETISAADLFRKHVETGARFEEAFPARFAGTAPQADASRRLRVGYVSGDLCIHPVALFLMPVLEGHDRNAFEVFAYSSGTTVDHITERIREACDHWVDATAMADAALADRIHADGIDILVDLSGHTGRSRLAMFCARPAPVQVTWLGYLNTTGLTRMGHRLCDARTDPIATAQPLHTETLRHLADSQWCYRPFLSQDVAAVAPFEKNGHVTFGSFNSALKITAAQSKRWAELLSRVSGSRLRVANVASARKQAAIRSEMKASGIDEARVSFVPRVNLDRYFDLFAEVDIALDTFPSGGGTTTFDALWMGVPVVTAMGETSVSRSASSILRALGLDAWVAASIDAYVDVAVARASDLPAIAALRSSLRTTLQASPLTDEPRFVRGLEAAYREMLASATG